VREDKPKLVFEKGGEYCLGGQNKKPKGWSIDGNSKQVGTVEKQIEVQSKEELVQALEAANPGTTIRVQSGTYQFDQDLNVPDAVGLTGIKEEKPKFVFSSGD